MKSLLAALALASALACASSHLRPDVIGVVYYRQTGAVRFWVVPDPGDDTRLVMQSILPGRCEALLVLQNPRTIDVSKIQGLVDSKRDRRRSPCEN